MLPIFLCGCLTAAGLGLLGQAYTDYKLYRKKFGPWDHWYFRGQRIEKGRRTYFSDGTSVFFTGRRLYVRDRWGHTDKFFIRQLGIRNGKGFVDIWRG